MCLPAANPPGCGPKSKCRAYGATSNSIFFEASWPHPLGTKIQKKMRHSEIVAGIDFFMAGLWVQFLDACQLNPP